MSHHHSHHPRPGRRRDDDERPFRDSRDNYHHSDHRNRGHAQAHDLMDGDPYFAERRKPVGLNPKYPNYEPFHPPPREDFQYPEHMRPPPKKRRARTPSPSLSPSRSRSRSRSRDRQRSSRHHYRHSLHRHDTRSRSRSRSRKRSHSPAPPESKDDISEKIRVYWEDDGSGDESGLDLEAELHPLAYHAHNRKRLLLEAVRSLKGKRLSAMIPPIIKDMSVEKLERECLEILDSMDYDTIINIIEGKVELNQNEKPTEATEASETVITPSEKKKRKKAKIKSDKVKDKEKTKEKEKVKLKRKTRKKKSRKKEAPAATVTTSDPPAAPAAKSLMELLELEYRAKAIKALLRTQGVNGLDIDTALDQGPKTEDLSRKGQQAQNCDKSTIMEQVDEALGVQEDKVDEKSASSTPTSIVQSAVVSFTKELDGDQLREKLLRNYRKQTKVEQVEESSETEKADGEDKDVLELHAEDSSEEKLIYEGEQDFQDEEEEKDASVEELSSEQEEEIEEENIKEEIIEEPEDGEVCSDDEFDKIESTENFPRSPLHSHSLSPSPSPSTPPRPESPVEFINDFENPSPSPSSEDEDDDKPASPIVLQPRKSVKINMPSSLPQGPENLDEEDSKLSNISEENQEPTPKAEDDEIEEPNEPSKNEDDEPPPVTWYERWFQSKSMQKVVKTNAIQKKLKKKLAEAKPTPPPAPDLSTDADGGQSVIGSLEEYEALFGSKQMELLKKQEEKAAAAKFEEGGERAEDEEEEEGNDDLWGDILGDD